MRSSTPALSLHDPANSAGTQHAISLALQMDAKLLHVSTLGFLPESHPEEPLRPADESSTGDAVELLGRSGYAQSKWVAEQLVWEATRMWPKLQAKVVRPGTVCGHPETGASNPKVGHGVGMAWCGYG